MSSSIAPLFESVIEFIGHLKEAINSDGAFTVDTLDNRVQELCRRINNLPIEERLQYRGELDALQDALASFESELCEKRDALREELSGLSSHRKASIAYRTPDAAGGE